MLGNPSKMRRIHTEQVAVELRNEAFKGTQYEDDMLSIVSDYYSVPSAISDSKDTSTSIRMTTFGRNGTQKDRLLTSWVFKNCFNHMDREDI